MPARYEEVGLPETQPWSVCSANCRHKRNLEIGEAKACPIHRRDLHYRTAIHGARTLLRFQSLSSGANNNKTGNSSRKSSSVTCVSPESNPEHDEPCFDNDSGNIAV
ncbi:unnamed protein product [Dibothriocephalus latus]|uniref:Uncharacterized protein n=1 Tax=Dibothriocephalus latus TaxID=60516 RepID=A0A3P7MKC5_DIBLA|nr:unnamed protein product [Dibothriocephalus latus]